jgi:hypothetical protein
VPFRKNLAADFFAFRKSSEKKVLGGQTLEPVEDVNVHRGADIVVLLHHSWSQRQPPTQPSEMPVGVHQNPSIANCRLHPPGADANDGQSAYAALAIAQNHARDLGIDDPDRCGVLDLYLAVVY